MTSTFDTEGIVLDRYTDILTRLVALAESKWGESIDTSEDEFLGHMFSQIALLVSELNEILQDVYDSISVQDATGTYLDRLVALIGMDRQAAAYSTVTLSITADRATTVPAGTRYATSTDLVFAIDSALVFTAAGTSTAAATCTITGVNNAAIGDITTIKDSVYGVTAVTNLVAATPGRLRETDAELKARHTIATSTSGDNDLASIFEAVSAVTGVSDVYVTENDTDATVGGIPAHYIYVTAIGGAAADIGEAIYNNKTSGVGTHGSETVAVYDDDISQVRDIHYDIAAEVDIHIEVDITTIDGVYPTDGDAQIKANFVSYFSDFKIGDDVIYNALYGSVYSVPGLVVNSLKVDTVDPPTGTSDITITALQKAVIAAADIDIV